MSAVIFFVVQVGLRTKQYFKYGTTIDIELYFEDQIPFPAVTICNQNSYRMSAAIDLELYHFLDAAYSTANLSSKNIYSNCFGMCVCEGVCMRVGVIVRVLL